jgi:hypothetical protein
MALGSGDAGAWLSLVLKKDWASCVVGSWQVSRAWWCSAAKSSRRVLVGYGSLDVQTLVAVSGASVGRCVSSCSWCQRAERGVD